MKEKAKKFVTEFFTLISRRSVIIPLVFAIAFLCVAASLSSINTFVIYEGEKTTVHNSNATKTSDALLELGINIGNDRYVEMPVEAENGIAEIYIFKKDKVTLKTGELSSEFYAEKDAKVSDLLAANNITLGEEDLISPSLDSDITDGMVIEITRVAHQYEEEYFDIPYSTEEINSDSLTKGTSRTVQNGQNGSRKVVYDVKLSNGVEESRTVISETIEREPIPQIIEHGTKPIDTSGTVTTWSGEKIKYKKKLAMTATAYTTEGSSDKITATGKVARVGFVAVDPNIIPYGTKLYIVSADGKSWCYGTAVAEDCGVKGQKIDLFFNTYNECINFGKRKATVYIL